MERHDVRDVYVTKNNRHSAQDQRATELAKSTETP
jgi:hypothetical protein